MRGQRVGCHRGYLLVTETSDRNTPVLHCECSSANVDMTFNSVVFAARTLSSNSKPRVVNAE